MTTGCISKRCHREKIAVLTLGRKRLNRKGRRGRKERLSGIGFGVQIKRKKIKPVKYIATYRFTCY